MNHQQNELLEYVQKQMQHGSDPERVRQALLGAGWDAATVNGALKHFAPKPAAPAAHHRPAVQHQPHHQQATHPTASHSPATATGQQHQPAAAQHPHHAQPHNQHTAATHNEDSAKPTDEAPEEYKVFQAIRDSFKAFQANPQSLSLGAVIGYSINLLVTGALVMAAISIIGGIKFSEGSPSSEMPLAALLVLTIVGVVAATASQTFVLNTLAIGFRAGAMRRKAPLKATLGAASRTIIRVSLAMLLSAAVTIGPFIAAGFIAAYLSLGSLVEPSDNTSATSDIAGLGISALLLLGTAVWAILAALRYALTPYVALFEKVKLVKALGRSHHLSKDGGQWFVFKGFLLYALISILIGAVVEPISGQGSSTNWLLTTVLSIPVELFVIGGMTMLYRNRQTVRGQK